MESISRGSRGAPHSIECPRLNLETLDSFGRTHLKGFNLPEIETVCVCLMGSRCRVQFITTSIMHTAPSPRVVLGKNTERRAGDHDWTLWLPRVSLWGSRPAYVRACWLYCASLRCCCCCCCCSGLSSTHKAHCEHSTHTHRKRKGIRCLCRTKAWGSR